jgi:hypothetical protein
MGQTLRQGEHLAWSDVRIAFRRADAARSVGDEAYGEGIVGMARLLWRVPVGHDQTHPRQMRRADQPWPPGARSSSAARAGRHEFGEDVEVVSGIGPHCMAHARWHQPADAGLVAYAVARQ